MAGKRIVSITTQTPTATADATNIVDATYPFLMQGGSSTQRSVIWEIYLGGQAASSSSPTFMILGRDSTICGTNSLGTGQNDVAMSTATAALAAPVLTGNTNSTKPQRSSTLHLMNLSFNAYGGIVRWAALDPTECPDIVGASVNVGEVSLSAFTGGTTGAIGAHMVYETL